MPKWLQPFWTPFGVLTLSEQFQTIINEPLWDTCCRREHEAKSFPDQQFLQIIYARLISKDWFWDCIYIYISQVISQNSCYKIVWLLSSFRWQSLYCFSIKLIEASSTNVLSRLLASQRQPCQSHNHSAAVPQLTWFGTEKEQVLRCNQTGTDGYQRDLDRLV